MKRTTLVLFLSICVSIKSCNTIKQNISYHKIEKEQIIVTVTMYMATVGQCDSTPLITACGYKINPKKASKHRWIALSRNLLSRWGGKFNYGDLIKISGTGHKDGIYMVCDVMNKRIKNTVDILETAGTKLYKFKNIIIEKVDF